MPSSSDDNLYLRAGIRDLAEFYRTKFVSDEVLDSRYFNPLDRFDMRFARTMWVYDNISSGSDVLDLGCGAGMLALLKRKNVSLTGVDLSTECALAAKRNGYDASFSASLSQLPFADNSFDYVVTLDVLGHVAFEEKDAVLTEIKRVLRPDGVTLHGIECTDQEGRRRFDEMNKEELRRFVEIDGHVGLEEEQQHAERFRRFFNHVKFEPRYALCLSSEEFIKQNDQYGLPFEDDFVDYLRGLSFKERRAFDMAMGYVFGKISDLHVELPGYPRRHRSERAALPHRPPYAVPPARDVRVCCHGRRRLSRDAAERWRRRSHQHVEDAQEIPAFAGADRWSPGARAAARWQRRPEVVRWPGGFVG